MSWFKRSKKINPNTDAGNLFQKRMDEVLAEPGVGEKLSALARLRLDIDKAIEDRMAEINEQARGKRHLPLWGGNTAQVLASVTAATITLNPIFLLTPLPGAAGVSYLADKRVEAAKKLLLEESKEYLKSLETQKTVAGDIIDRLLEDHTQEVAECNRRDFLFEKYPDIKSRFAAVAARKMASRDTPPPQQKPDDPFNFGP